MDPQKRSAIIKDAMSKFKYNPKLQTKSHLELLVEKAKRSTYKVQYDIKPILAAGGGFDKPALQDMVSHLYLEEFNQYSRDELINLVTMMHTEEMMNTIDASPFGKDTPDQLGGV